MMPRKYLLFLLFFWNVPVQAQTAVDSLVGDWKCYLADSASFEFLRLNPDGTGIKCFGHTVDGEDKLFLDGDATLTITRWRAEGNKLIIESKNKDHFQADPEFRYTWVNGTKLSLEGEHILLGFYPSDLIKKRFQRVVVYQRPSTFAAGYGIKAATCLFKDLALFSLRPIDSTFQLAEYKGFDDLIPHLISCNVNFLLVPHYPDPPYSLMIPRGIHRWSFGYSNMAFYISLQSKEEDDPVTTIQIYYDFDNSLRNFYFTEMQNGKREKDSVLQNGRAIYKTKSSQGKFEGDIFVGHSLIVSYFTKDEKMQEALQMCIASFQYTK
jgi:hypothetical protein